LNDSNCSIPKHSITPEAPGRAQANNIVPADEASLAQAVELLRAGDVVGLPTETVYGLAGDALNPAALARIFEVKQRPLYDPLILHFADAERALEVAAQVPKAARLLAERFWPGPLTLVLEKKELVPDLATSGLPKVALRVPAHPVSQALLRAFGGPLAAPSANRFGRISPTDARAVQAELGDAVPLILDGGPCAVGVESTVLEVREDGITLLRAGGISAEEIVASVGPVRRGAPVLDKPLAPGQLAHHYAPRKPLRRIGSLAEIPHGAGAGVLAFGPVQDSVAGVVENLSPRGDLREAAAHFFRALRSLDDNPRVEILYALPVPAHGLGLAINERMERASGR
jgi:L-threonylcarbamoyladenylate synthase